MTEIDPEEVEAAERAAEAARALAAISCPYCQKVISAHEVISPGHCGGNACFLAQLNKTVKAREELRRSDYEDRQNSAKEQLDDKLSAAAKFHDTTTDELLVAVVPFQNEPIEPLDAAQRDAFEAHLHRVVEEAFVAEPGDILMLNYIQKTDAEPEIIDAGCAACQGFCCKRGGGDNHAFLTRQTVYHLRDTKPELEPAEIIEHYLNALPDQSVRGACVFQSEVGCTLEREWRAALCNSFHCHDLHAMHDLTDGRADVPLAIVGINDDIAENVVAFGAEKGWEKI